MFRGMILWWGDDEASIPYGWQKCDGTNGTPNLKNRFVIGAGSTYNPGDVGGPTTHFHNFTSDNHFHILAFGSGIAAGALNHWILSSEPVTGNTGLASSRPPYYALLPIMKL